MAKIIPFSIAENPTQRIVRLMRLLLARHGLANPHRLEAARVAALLGG